MPAEYFTYLLLDKDKKQVIGSINVSNKAHTPRTVAEQYWIDELDAGCEIASVMGVNSTWRDKARQAKTEGRNIEQYIVEGEPRITY